MNPSKSFHPEALTILILAAVLIIGACTSLYGQLTIEGRITGTTGNLELHLIDADGFPVPIQIKGKRKPRYSFTVESRNANFCLRVQRKGFGTRYLHIFTHQPDGYIVKWYEEIDIPGELPENSIIYWSPSQRNYIRALGITAEDLHRLGDMQLAPQRIHPSIIQE